MKFRERIKRLETDAGLRKVSMPDIPLYKVYRDSDGAVMEQLMETMIWDAENGHYEHIKENASPRPLTMGR